MDMAVFTVKINHFTHSQNIARKFCSQTDSQTLLLNATAVVKVTWKDLLKKRLPVLHTCVQATNCFLKCSRFSIIRIQLYVH